jgi:phosphoglycerate dehydrogenase-like enzyme
VGLKVYIPGATDEVFEQSLRDAVDPGIEIVSGEERPDPADYDVLVTGRPSEEDLEASVNLKMLIVPWSGISKKTCEMALSRPRIAVHNIHHSAPAVTEMAIGLLLAAARGIVPADRSLRRGDWRRRYQTDTGVRLAGRTALVLGYGAIGRRVVRVLEAMDMDVTALRRRHVRDRDAERTHEVRRLDALEELLPSADVLMICLPSTDDTRGLLDARLLALLPEGALLVNIARGNIVDEEALYEALRSGRLGGAGLDVWYRYPPTEDERSSTLPSRFPFQVLENVVLSPHRAGHGLGTEELRGRHVAEVVNALKRGEEPPGRVNVERGY